MLNSFFQKSSLFIYKSWFFTISIYICQNIHFADILIKYKSFIKSFSLKNTNFFVCKFFQKSSFFLYKSWVSTFLLYICQDIHFTGILNWNKKSLKLSNTNFWMYVLFNRIVFEEMSSWTTLTWHLTEF